MWCLTHTLKSKTVWVRHIQLEIFPYQIFIMVNYNQNLNFFNIAPEVIPKLRTIRIF